MPRHLLCALAVLLVSVGAAPAPTWAADPPAAERAYDAKQEAKDAKVVSEALKAFGREGYAALPSRLEALNTVLDHAPASYPRIETRGHKRIIRTFGGEVSPPVVLGALIGAAKDGVSVTAVAELNVYPAASFMVGAYANETKQPLVAIEALDRGLKLQPDEGMLLSEKGSAYISLNRPADGLALYEPWFAAMPIDGLPHRARLLRAKGFALIELGRLDEAETAYRDSLKLEPGHGGAQRELTYIAQLRGGGERQGVEMKTSAEAKKP